MKHILLLVTLALMLAAAMALSGVAQAKPIGGSADAKCAKLARETLGASYTPANYTFIGGTEGNDNFDGLATAGPDVFCGFGGNDSIFDLEAGDIFLGGDGNDSVVNYNSGTFYGGAGNDYGGTNEGTFYGGVDADFVSSNSGTFYGEEGDDQVVGDNLGTFYGGAGNDYIAGYNNGIFWGGGGNDAVFDGNPPLVGP